MYSYDKIKSVLVIYNTRLKYELTIDDILKIMQIARSTLYNWINKFSFLLNNPYSFSLTRKMSNTLRQSLKISSVIKDFIINHITKTPNFNMKKLIKKINKVYNITISKGYVYKILHNNNLSLKKVQKITYPYGKTKFKKCVKILKKEIDNCNNDFTAIDETAVYLGTSNTYGWAKKGTRCQIKSTFNRSNKYSLCQAISNKSVVGSALIKGSFNMVKYNSFVMDIVVPNMTNSTILMDGATIHKSKDLFMKLNEKGIKRVINVPYSPQFNPIEYTFNTLKRKIKNSNVTTLKQLEKTIQKHNKINNTL